MKVEEKYETVIGLEIHAQLKTVSKLFCGDDNLYGSEPNTSVSAISLAHPGTLPLLNEKAVEYAVMLGLALNCNIQRNNYFARKNYFYPDLPKGYQVSQHTAPICVNGYLDVDADGKRSRVRLNRIHMEEDAGKSIHDADDEFSYVDYNRAGTPLVEIVTEPDIRTAEEAAEFLASIRKIVRYLGVCDGNMEEGSLRCDANISVRKKGETELGVKVEVKNLNSIRFLRKAIEHESKRLTDLIENGKPVLQQTRSFDANTNTTFAIRDKEDADDYRYFPEPDLVPFSIDEEWIGRLKIKLPELQPERMSRYARDYNLSDYDVKQLTEEIEVASYFESLIKHGVAAKPAANWITGPIRSWLNEYGVPMEKFPMGPRIMSEVIKLVEDGKVSFSTASSKLLHEAIRQENKPVMEIVEEMNLLQQSDEGQLNDIIEGIINDFPDKVNAFKKGKKGLLALFVGEVMKRTKGKADPKITNEILLKKLK